MPGYYLIYLIIFLTGTVWLVRYFILRRTSLPGELFQKGLQTENNGNFEEAAINYENALHEAKKNWFQNDLRNKILVKLKTLRTVNDYEKSQTFVRKQQKTGT